MQAGLFAKKVGMTQIFDESETILPVTVLETGLCQVSQIKIRVDISYATHRVNTIYGVLGIKVWIFNKEIF